MAQRTIMRLYEGYDTVVQIVHRLELAGVPDREISVITSNVDSRYPVLAEAAQRSTSPIRSGAVIGAVIGGSVGTLAGVGSITIDVLQPIADAGWFPALLVGAAVGAVAGAIVGGIARLVMRRDPALVYAEGIRRGNTLLTVRVEEELVPRVEMLMGVRTSAGAGTATATRAAPARPAPFEASLEAAPAEPRRAAARPAPPPARAPDLPEGYDGGGWSRFEPSYYVTPADLDEERRRINAANERIQNE